jgi:hypothetical protein
MGVIELTPSEIRYSQDSISNTFRARTSHAGQYIGETLDEIVRDPDTVDLIPNISVFKKGVKKKWFTLDNRRLWVFKKAEKLGIISYIDVYVTYGIEDSKFTTTSNGKYVFIRGNNPGGYLWQSLRRKMIEKKARKQARQQEIETERQQREREQQMEKEQQHREREQLEIERQRRMNTKKWITKASLICLAIVVLLFLYWATRQ